MNFSEYQREAMKFARYTNQDYPFLALSEEVGEVMGKLAKFNRKNNLNLATSIHRAALYSGGNYAELKSDLEKEFGDVLWQLQACCSEFGLNLNDVAELNLKKLGDRDERGVIVGEGDNR